MKFLAPAAAILLSGCFFGDENNWADREQIIAAASRCGVPNFQPTPAGSAFAAYVPGTVPNAQAKEDCIYSDLRGQGLLVTR